MKQALAVLLSIAATTAGKEFPTHLAPVVLKPCARQLLPGGILGVFVGPDDRTWYQLDRPAQREDAAVVQRVVESVFADPVPQLFGCRPAFFEPSGRVWFLTHSSTALLAYDGREWLRRDAPDGQFFTGNCPGHGRVGRRGCNLAADGRLFFPASHGIDVFDGRNWQYQACFDPAAERFPSLSLRAWPDGRSVLAVARSRAPALTAWSWRAGTWTPHAFDPEQVTDVFPSAAPGAVWVAQSNGTLRRQELGPVPAAADARAAVAGLLAASPPPAAAAAAAGLRPYGPLAREALEQAMAQTYDPASLALLVAVAEDLVRDATRLRAGELDIGAAWPIFCDETTGLAVFHARDTRMPGGGDAVDRGLLVLNGSSDPLFLPGEDATRGWNAVMAQNSGPLLDAASGAVWLPTGHDQDTPHRLSLQDGRVLDRVPVAGFRWLHARRGDGTLFVGRYEPGQGRSAIAAYRPGQPDDRRSLEVETIACGCSRTAAGSI